MIIAGLDLSLTATGVAHIFTANNEHATYTLRSPSAAKIGDHGRLDWICKQIAIHTGQADLVIVEGPAFGAKGSAVHQLAGIWWMVTHQLWQARVPFAVVGPQQLKKYATGKAAADKDAMVLATARRFDTFDGDNNAADALWLAHAGADRHGHPIVTLPQAQRAVLDAVQWPSLTGRN